MGEQRVVLSRHRGSLITTTEIGSGNTSGGLPDRVYGLQSFLRQPLPNRGGPAVWHWGAESRAGAFSVTITNEIRE